MKANAADDPVARAHDWLAAQEATKLFLAAVASTIAQHTPAGDAAFRQLVFGSSTALGPFEVTEEAALALRDGIHQDAEHSPHGNGPFTFAHTCYRHGRVDLLRQVYTAAHPQVVAGVDVSTGSAWMEHLCSRRDEGVVRYSSSLVRMGFIQPTPHSVDIIELALEVDPEDMHAKMAIARNDKTSPYVKEAVMRMAVRSSLASADEQMPTAPLRRRSPGI